MESGVCLTLTVGRGGSAGLEYGQPWVWWAQERQAVACWYEALIAK